MIKDCRHTKTTTRRTKILVVTLKLRTLGEGAMIKREKYFSENTLSSPVCDIVKCLYHSRLFPIDKIHIFIRFDVHRVLHMGSSYERVEHSTFRVCRVSLVIENRTN